MENIKRMEKPTDEKCERCGAPLVIKWGKHGSFYACSTYDKEDPNSCTFTKENPINLPDLDSADMQETAQEEYCENCGRVMVLKRGRFGQFMACTGYPDCKTTRRLDQGKKVPDIPLDEKCPECGRNMIIRHGRYGEFTSCSGYPGLQVREAELYRREVSANAAKASWSKSGRARAIRSTDAPIIRSANSLRRPSRLPRSVRVRHEYLVEKNPKDGTGDCVSEQGMRLRAGERRRIRRGCGEIGLKIGRLRQFSRTPGARITFLSFYF